MSPAQRTGAETVPRRRAVKFRLFTPRDKSGAMSSVRELSIKHYGGTPVVIRGGFYKKVKTSLTKSEDKSCSAELCTSQNSIKFTYLQLVTYSTFDKQRDLLSSIFALK